MMFRVRRLLAPFVLCIALLFSEAQAFTIAWLSDTQNYHNAYKPIFDGMTQWIADNREALDIRFVFHTGDVVGSWSSEDSGGRPGNHGHTQQRLHSLPDGMR